MIPVVPKEISPEALKELGSMPKCKHGFIMALCSICNKEAHDE